MKIQAIPASEIKWVGNQGSMLRSRTGFGAGSPPVISVYGRYSQKKFYKDVDKSLEQNRGCYISECGEYTIEII